MMRAIIILGILSGSCLLLTGLMRPAPPQASGVGVSIAYFRKEAPEFAKSCKELFSALQSIDPSTPPSLGKARQKLIECRLHYKKIEFFLEYFFRSSSRIYNSPPKYEGEEPDMEYQSPVGLQVIESLLYQPPVAGKKNELLQQAGAVAGSAADLSSLLYDFQTDDRQILESLRVELIRVITLGITGYDAPSLKSGLAESYEVLQSMRFQLQPYLTAGETRSDSLLAFLDKAIGQLRNNPGFDAFDRVSFLTGSALPLQRQLRLFIRERKLELNTNGVLNYEADNLFSPDALVADNFPRGDAAPGAAEPAGLRMGPVDSAAEAAGCQSALIAAGQKLFFDKTLSGNGQRSCATCHNPEKMFTDQLPSNKTFDGHGLLRRNTPTLLYSGFQYRQFWDGKVNTLEEQVKTVLRDPLEMNGAARGEAEMGQLSAAIAAYVRSLHPFNSPFDRYMQGDNRALGLREKKGANLFMGKAQCATCHFIPLFNGLIPPDYKLTEFEVLGTTRTDEFNKPRLSADEGRYALYPFAFYKGAFKTPTVRNTALTYPYMHNGAYHSLEKVLEFYNKGGGAGLGLKVPAQTLPDRPLHLSKEEMEDIILFLKALTDDVRSPRDGSGHKS
ncbi:MAG TPA: cytochrome c peroxidase [Puia sp.]|nr:cytochrome c peroxidase [Puia sp.]